jgi:hypothetical protein
MNRITILSLGLAVLTPNATPLMSAGALAPDDCPVTCVPTPGGDGDVPPGSGPPGTTFSITFGATTPGLGMGTNQLCSPCAGSYCKQAISVNFDGYSTGWCFQYTWTPIGTPAPMGKFHRDGYLYTVCDTSVAFTWQVVDCATGGTIYTQGQHTLTCACPGGG